MPSLSVAIMAHPARAAMVERLLDKLGDVPVAWAERKNDLWGTRRRATLACDLDCTHHLVLQDDVMICRDLVAGVERALEHVPPDVPASLYIGQRRPDRELVKAACAKARESSASWVVMPTLLWGPAVVLPTAAIPDMVEYCDTLKKMPHDDRRMGMYWERISPTWYTWPSLVDHADGPSMAQGRMGTDRSKPQQLMRVAFEYVGNDASALEADWAGPVVQMEGAT